MDKLSLEMEHGDVSLIFSRTESEEQNFLVLCSSTIRKMSVVIVL